MTKEHSPSVDLSSDSSSEGEKEYELDDFDIIRTIGELHFLLFDVGRRTSVIGRRSLVIRYHARPENVGRSSYIIS